MQCKDSIDEVGVFFNHTERIHRSDSGFTNVAESDKLNLMSLSWRRIQPGWESLVSACRAKNFALAAVKAALFHFHTTTLVRYRPTGLYYTSHTQLSRCSCLLNPRVQ
jgi:hypothetical protein